jgi:hypothetical protein
MENWLNGRPAVGGLTGERPAVVLRWWGKWLWVIFGFREERTEERLWNGCTAEGKNGGKGREK